MTSAARRSPDEEQRWAALLAVLVAVLVQVALPDHLTLGPTWLLPAIEAALAIALLIAHPFRHRLEATILRRGSMLLVAVISVANGFSAVLLIRGLIHGSIQGGAPALLASGAGIYLTNIIAFALWYWELAGGGPAARAEGRAATPDFLFPQMTSPSLAPPSWRPTFIDFLYVSFTNATAFSPTDTMPLSRWAKMLMLLQSAIALLTVSLVIARAVNIFH
ncbi:hypothetical protein [Amnibacterium sp.]|uniref:hypothetical protein n=1 Tax=Amnibacterium sp. TaxID=1872496 RepID=UPI003F7BD7C9